MKALYRSKLFWFLIALALVRVVGRVMMPFWVRDYMNQRLSELKDHRSSISFSHAPSAADSQAGLDQPWTKTVKDLFPLKINRFVVQDGEMHYRDFHKSLKVNVVFESLRRARVGAREFRYPEPAILTAVIKVFATPSSKPSKARSNTKTSRRSIKIRNNEGPGAAARTSREASRQ